MTRTIRIHIPTALTLIATLALALLETVLLRTVVLGTVPLTAVAAARCAPVPFRGKPTAPDACVLRWLPGGTAGRAPPSDRAWRTRVSPLRPAGPTAERPRDDHQLRPRSNRSSMDATPLVANITNVARQPLLPSGYAWFLALSARCNGMSPQRSRSGRRGGLARPAGQMLRL